MAPAVDAADVDHGTAITNSFAAKELTDWFVLTRLPRVAAQKLPGPNGANGRVCHAAVFHKQLKQMQLGNQDGVIVVYRYHIVI